MEGAQSSRCIIKDMCAQLRASWCRGINNFMGHKTQADQVDSSLMYDYDMAGIGQRVGTNTQLTGTLDKNLGYGTI